MFAKNNQKKTQMRNQKQQQKDERIELRATGWVAERFTHWAV